MRFSFDEQCVADKEIIGSGKFQYPLTFCVSITKTTAAMYVLVAACSCTNMSIPVTEMKSHLGAWHGQNGSLQLVVERLLLSLGEASLGRVE